MQKSFLVKPTIFPSIYLPAWFLFNMILVVSQFYNAVYARLCHAKVWISHFFRRRSTAGTSTTHVYNSASQIWTPGTPYLHEVFAVGSLPVVLSSGINHLVFGGVTPSGEEPSQVYEFDATTRGYNQVLDLENLGGGRSHYVGVPVAKDQPCPSQT